MDADRDAVGDAFEVFIGPALRGAEGQFFTPQNVVQMVVDILDPQERQSAVTLKSLRRPLRLLPASPHQAAHSFPLRSRASDSEGKETDLVFPGCRQISQRAKLPIRGQALRHSYSTVAVDLKINDLTR